MTDEYFMQDAIRQAVKAYEADEVPVGAVVVREGAVIARAWNQVELLKDATAHAEMIALTAAEAAVGDWRLTGCTLYVTKEPCPMCAGAILSARIGFVAYGAPDPAMGGLGGAIDVNAMPKANHRAEVVPGLLEQECLSLIQGFFQAARAEKNSSPTASS